MRRSLGLVVIVVTASLLFVVAHRAALKRHTREGAESRVSGERVLTIAQAADLESMDPHNMTTTSSLNISALLWGTLVKITAEGTLVPSMASGFHWNDAGTELSFDIKPGLTCEDGTAFTARDVVYTLNRAADPKALYFGHLPGFVYSSIGFQGARLDGELKATVLVKGYSSQAAGMLAQAAMLCRGSYEKLSSRDAAEHAYATGPYKLREWIKDDRVILERNDQYTLARGIYDKVIFRAIAEPSTRAAELIAGTVDLITNVAPDQRSTIDESGTAVVKPVEGTRRMFVGYNFQPSFGSTLGGAALQKKEVRQALNYAVDVPTICAQLLQMPCRRVAAPTEYPGSSVTPYPYDPDKAEAMLDAAGYPRGPDRIRFRLTLQAPRNRYLADSDVEQAVAQYLSDIGVETKVETMDFNTVYVSLTRRHEAGPLFFIGQGGSTWSAMYDISLFSSRLSPTNNGAWYNQQWQDGLDSLKNVRDPVREREIVERMMVLFKDEAPWLFLYRQPDLYGVGPKIEFTPRRDEVIEVMAIRPKR